MYCYSSYREGNWTRVNDLRRTNVGKVKGLFADW